MTATCHRRGMRRLVTSVSLVLLLLCCVTAAPAPVVHLECGPARGAVMPNQNSILAFMGIPYAAPPTGARRFQPPQTLMEANAYEATAAYTCIISSGAIFSGD